MQDLITVYDSMDAPDTSGSSLKGHLLYGITYNMLVDFLGEPTFLPEDSGDGKVNFQWVIEFETENGGLKVFTIYDWKTESPEWSRLNTGTKEQASEWFGGSRWHVGGKYYAGDFIDFIEKEIKELVAS
jgi:hypothetical protein